MWHTGYLSKNLSRKLCYIVEYIVFTHFLVQETLLQIGIQCVCQLLCPKDIVKMWHTVYLSTPLSKRLCYNMACSVFLLFLVQETLLRCGINYICPLSFPRDFVMIWHTVYLFPLLFRRLCYGVASFVWTGTRGRAPARPSPITGTTRCAGTGWQKWENTWDFVSE